MPAQLMAAKGVIPGAKPHEIVIAISVLAGRDDEKGVRRARDSTSICPDAREPIDPRMPHLPPA